MLSVSSSSTAGAVRAPPLLAGMGSDRTLALGRVISARRCCLSLQPESRAFSAGGPCRARTHIEHEPQHAVMVRKEDPHLASSLAQHQVQLYEPRYTGMGLRRAHPDHRRHLNNRLPPDHSALRAASTCDVLDNLSAANAANTLMDDRQRVEAAFKRPARRSDPGHLKCAAVARTSRQSPVWSLDGRNRCHPPEQFRSH